MYCQSFENCGYCALASPEIWRLSASHKVAINENYGRELLELHTLGADGGYTQQDVIAAARALTGWSIATPREGGAFVFRPEWHDAEPKSFLGVTLPAGRGIDDGEQVLDIVARHPSTARYIATKLVRRFVSDSPPGSLVERAAVEFQRSDGDIRRVMALIISSPEYAHGVPGALKNALDWLVGGPELYQKPVGLLNPSPRSTHAHAALVEILTTMAARVSSEASAVVPLSGRPLDAAAIVGDPELSLAIRSALDALVRAASTPARGL